ncbi:MAG: TIGR03663 family protein [Anaerolineae bacterium]|nr:TIGR03663 family protein [Anaerolineae bacterium]
MSMTNQHSSPSLISQAAFQLNAWRIIMVVILLLAVFTRLIWLGDRAVSHDETTHAKYSWNFYSGRGFRHDPLMHGPLLFEATGLFYFIFGVNDFAARLYTALAGILLVLSPVLLKKWLGKLGTLVASTFLLISPLITYYSRYTRHDIPILLAVVLLLWTVFNYLEDGKTKWLLFMAAFFALMFAAKENAYIYTAIFMVLLALPFLWWLLTTPWSKPNLIKVLLPVLALALVAGAVFVVSFRGAQTIIAGEGNNDIGAIVLPVWGRLGAAVAFGSLVASLVLCLEGVGRKNTEGMRLFDILMVLASFTLPLGSALLMKFAAGVDMAAFYPGLMAMNFSAVSAGSVAGAFGTLIILIALSIFLGMWWDRRRWPSLALVFYVVFFVLYSSLFTWGWGMVTGLVGGLAYWIAQQDVQRGSQPWYYYGIVGPLYEYLPLALSLLAAGPAVGWLFKSNAAPSKNSRTANSIIHNEQFCRELPQRAMPAFLLAWALVSWGAYAVAGEKMPWLFVHIVFPHILLAAWGTDRWLRGLTWRDMWSKFGWLVPLTIFFLWQAVRAFRKSTGALDVLQQTLAVSGVSDGLSQLLAQLDPLARIIGGLGGVLLCSLLLVWALDKAGTRKAVQLIFMSVLLIVGGFTLRTMVMANYINDELAKEMLVYAHATPDVKLALDEIESISWRLTGTPDQIQVAYGKEVAWPFYWYMDTRFPNNYYYLDKPDAEQLLECPVIVAARQEWPDVSEIVGVDYIYFDYKHIWWPIEDYKDLTWERIQTVLSDPEMRTALRDIIVNRDYQRYAQLKNPEDPFTLKTWPHRMEFRLYVRKDLARQIWRYRLGQADADTPPLDDDPFADDVMTLTPISEFMLPQLAGHDIAVAGDRSIFVTDSANHKLIHLSDQGAVLAESGGYGVDPGEFNESWGIDVDQDGNLYIADTWNHRIQKLDAEGNPILSWGRYGQSQVYEITGQGAFFGPRDLAVGPDGRIYVTDTGNNRVQIFERDGNYFSEFGGTGDTPGFMNEPVGIAISDEGEVFIADSWNQRIQVFDLNGVYVRSWDIPGWATERQDAKPFLTENAGTLYVADPVMQRVLVFTREGAFLRGLRDPENLDLPGGLAVIDDLLYVVDLTQGAVLGYDLSEINP